MYLVVFLISINKLRLSQGILAEVTGRGVEEVTGWIRRAERCQGEGWEWLEDWMVG